jgi:hypothetical protein
MANADAGAMRSEYYNIINTQEAGHLALHDTAEATPTVS